MESGVNHSYEKKLRSLLTLKLCQNENLDNIELKIKYPPIKAFEDIRFRYKTISDNQRCTIYAKIIQEQNESTVIPAESFYDPESNYCLLRHFQNFKRIMDSKPTSKDTDVFILYTNADFNPASVAEQPESELFHHNLLMTTGKVYQFILGKNRHIDKLIDDPLKRDFFKKFLIFVNQSNTKEIDNDIRKLLTSLLNCDNLSEDIVPQFVDFVDQIYTQIGTQYKQPFQRKYLIYNIMWFFINTLHMPINDEVSRKSFKVDDYEWFINELTIKQLIVFSEHNDNVVDVVKNCIERNREIENYLYLPLAIAKNIKYLPEIWRTFQVDAIVLESKQPLSLTEKEFILKMIEVLTEKTYRLIIICKGDDNLNHILDSELCKKIPVLATLKDLENEGPLMTRSLRYFGNKVLLKNIIKEEEELKFCFKLQHLILIRKSRTLDINFRNGFKDDYYFRDNFVREVKITAVGSDILECDNFDGNILCLSGNLEEYHELLNEIKGSFIHLKNIQTYGLTELDFHRIIIISEDSTEKLSKIQNEIVLLESKWPRYKFFHVHAENIALRSRFKPILRLMTFPEHSHFFDIHKYIYDEYYITDLFNFFINPLVINGYDLDNSNYFLKRTTRIIVGDPGLGKTHHCREILLHTTLPFLVLNNTHFDNVQNLSDIFENFKKSELTRDIFDCCCRKKSLLILVDGFDEINLQRQDIALEIIEQIHSNGYSLLITTKPESAHLLEDKLKVVPHNLRSMDKDIQEKYLYNYLSKALNIEETSRLKIISKALLNSKQGISDTDRRFVAEPLQWLILAENLLPKIQKYISNQDYLEIIIPQNITNLLDMYQTYLNQKIEICSSSETPSFDEATLKQIKNEELDAFKKYGMMVIFNKFSDFQTSDQSVSCRSRTKIIRFYKRSIGGIDINFPDFIHRTVGEYCAALYLAENLQSESATLKMFLKSRCYDGVKYFFDLILSKDCPLISGVVRNDMNQINQIIKTNENGFINVTDNGGRTALHVAALWGIRSTEKYHDNIEICKLLLENKIDVNIKDKINNWNAIQYADATRALRTLNELINKADIIDEMIPNLIKDFSTNAKDTLEYSVANGLTEIIEFFTKNEPDTCMPWFCGSSNKTAKIKELGNHLAVILIQNNLLHTAAKHCQTDMVKLLLTKGLDINHQDEKTRTPLHIAVTSRSDELVEICIKNGADINHRTCDGRTPLYEAVILEHLPIVRLLITHGADVNIADEIKQTPLHIASTLGNNEVVKLLLDAPGVDMNKTSAGSATPLQLAVQKGHVEVVRTLIERGANQNDESCGNTLLHIAVENGHLDVINYLLGLPTYSVNCLNANKEPPLVMAIIRGHDGIAKLLIDSGADINIKKNSHSSTPLHDAAFWGREEVVFYLLSSPTLNDVDARNWNGRTPLHMAMERGHMDIAKMLVAYGADSSIKDATGKMPFELAKGQFDEELIHRQIEDEFEDVIARGLAALLLASLLSSE